MLRRTPKRILQPGKASGVVEDGLGYPLLSAVYGKMTRSYLTFTKTKDAPGSSMILAELSRHLEA